VLVRNSPEESNPCPYMKAARDFGTKTMSISLSLYCTLLEMIESNVSTSDHL